MAGSYAGSHCLIDPMDATRWRVRASTGKLAAQIPSHSVPYIDLPATLSIWLVDQAIQHDKTPEPPCQIDVADTSGGGFAH